MRYAELPNLRDLLTGLASRATRHDLSGDWPDTDLSVLANVGAMRWAIPMEFGGEDYSPLEIHFRYEAIASASLTTALILTQRDSAIDFIESARDWSMRPTLLRRMANNELFATIGIAQLTTSRQGGAPALRATRQVHGAYQLDGLIPWCTGAAKAALIIAGAVLDDGQQILFALPTDTPGVHVDLPMPLSALRSSWTTSVRCEGVILEEKWILRGPTERALTGARGKSLALGQTFLATGLAGGALDLIAQHDSDQARQAHGRLDRQLQALRERVLTLSAPAHQADAASAGALLRGACSELALRCAHVAVTLYKGAALLNDHPAQRLAREALFLLVWSCPVPVIDCTIELLSAERDAGD